MAPLSLYSSTLSLIALETMVLLVLIKRKIREWFETLNFKILAAVLELTKVFLFIYSSKIAVFLDTLMAPLKTGTKLC